MFKATLFLIKLAIVLSPIAGILYVLSLAVQP